MNPPAPGLNPPRCVQPRGQPTDTVSSVKPLSSFPMRYVSYPARCAVYDNTTGKRDQCARSVPCDLH